MKSKRLSILFCMLAYTIVFVHSVVPHSHHCHEHHAQHLHTVLNCEQICTFLPEANLGADIAGAIQVSERFISTTKSSDTIFQEGPTRQQYDLSDKFRERRCLLSAYRPLRAPPAV